MNEIPGCWETFSRSIVLDELHDYASVVDYKDVSSSLLFSFLFSHSHVAKYLSLEIIRTRLDRKRYRTATEFFEDIFQMLTNALAYAARFGHRRATMVQEVNVAKAIFDIAKELRERLASSELMPI